MKLYLLDAYHKCFITIYDYKKLNYLFETFVSLVVILKVIKLKITLPVDTSLSMNDTQKYFFTNTNNTRVIPFNKTNFWNFLVVKSQEKSVCVSGK